MKRIYTAWNPMGTVILIILSLAMFLGRPALGAQDPWPKRFEAPKGTVVMYQPQLESFKNDVLTGRAAVSVQTKKMKAPIFGAVWLSGHVVTDRDTRMATISEVKVTDAKFPNAKPERLEKLKNFLNTEMAEWSIPISLDRLLASLEVVKKEQAGDRGLKNAPPKIIFASHPTVLVPLDGDPKLLPVPKSSLMRVANTPFLMLYDPPAKTYYLKGGANWLAATDLKGRWKDVDQVPEAIKTLEASALKGAQGKGAPKQVKAKAGQMPAIVVSTVPTELLATNGEPQYTPIKDTNLLFVSNTENNIFMDTTNQAYYALISGRWFKTKSLADGSWSYVAPNQLPADFAKIPENSIKGFVLVNVAGTPQAKEAVLDNSIPQTAVIDREKATTQVNYAGDPKFEPIAGTDLKYAVNTGTAVFQEGAKYYAVDQGIWYEADSPNGPWQVSVNPPQEVNKIPPSNPHYNTKYVKVYDSSDNTVTVGYTPGYTGSYVDNGTVVYGTGYDYSGYSAPDAYIPPPATYGYAAAYDPYAGTWGYQSPYYNPASWLVPGLLGFAGGLAVGAISSNWWGHSYNYWGGGGYWGPGGYNNVNINNIQNNVINPRPPRPGPGPRPPHWKPGERPGRPGGRPGVRPGERPGRPSTRPAERRNLYNRPGNAQRLASRPGKPVTRPARPAQAARPRPATQPKVRPAKGPNNVLADRNGNVYRRGSRGNWQQRQGGQWKPATTHATRPAAVHRPTPAPRRAVTPRAGFQPRQLNREFAARQRGNVRTQNFRRASAGARFGGGGGPRGGGGFSRPSGGRGGGARGGGGRGGRR
jgi:hypothetical protein